MPRTVDQSDPFMDLLTDALRAGPGSPEWHQAILELRKQQQGGHNAEDEYHLLWTARERLASGKEYRSVRPGPGFTRKLLDQIDRLPVPAKKRPTSLPTLIALVSILVLLAVIATVAYWIYTTSDHASAPKEDLTTLVLPSTVLDTTFDTTIPPDLRPIGALPLTPDHGLHPATLPAPSSKDYTGAGLITTSPLTTTAEPLELTATFTGPLPADDSLVPQLFATDQPDDLSPDRGTSPHELTCTLHPHHTQVTLPDGHLASDTQTSLPTTFTLRLLLGPTQALITLNNQPLYTGPHSLSPTRHLGLRFLQRPSTSTTQSPTPFVLQSLQIQKAPASH